MNFKESPKKNLQMNGEERTNREEEKMNDGAPQSKSSIISEIFSHSKSLRILEAVDKFDRLFDAINAFDGLESLRLSPDQWSGPTSTLWSRLRSACWLTIQRFFDMLQSWEWSSSPSLPPYLPQPSPAQATPFPKNLLFAQCSAILNLFRRLV